MKQNLKDTNRQRDLLNYEYSHLYNIARKGVKYTLPPLTKQGRVRVSGEYTDTEYGVVVMSDGKRKCWRLSTFERCTAWSQAHGGSVVRLGRNSNSHGLWDAISLPFQEESALPLAVVDESGVVEFQDVKIEGDRTINGLISTELTNLGWPRAIQCDRTPPPATALYELHHKHSEISFEDFAVAVLKHCEVSVVSQTTKRQPLSVFKTDEEKEAWYLTPAGQQWLKEYSIPPIMNHQGERGRGLHGDRTWAPTRTVFFGGLGG